MPMYDYQCPRCGDFREIRPMAESRLPRACPACGSLSERRLRAPFLAGGDGGGGVSMPRCGDPNRVSWRSACGLGCTHAH